MIDNQNSDQSIISLFMAKRDHTVISMPHKVQIYFYTNDFFQMEQAPRCKVRYGKILELLPKSLLMTESLWNTKRYQLLCKTL